METASRPYTVLLARPIRKTEAPDLFWFRRTRSANSVKGNASAINKQPLQLSGDICAQQINYRAQRAGRVSGRAISLLIALAGEPARA